MNITTTILTVGSALRHAQSHGVPVHVLVEHAAGTAQPTPDRPEYAYPLPASAAVG